MKVILFQGNYPKEYEDTRHNIAFKFADRLADKKGLNFTVKNKYYANILEFKYREEKVLLVKPNTFYNDTGKSVRAICDFYKVNWQKDLLVICDDLDLLFGEVRARQSGSSAGNNGLKSISKYLNDDKFTRIKIGIKSKLYIDHKIDASDFVLGKFNSEEKLKQSEIFDIVEEFIGLFLQNNLQNIKKIISNK